MEADSAASPLGIRAVFGHELPQCTDSTGECKSWPFQSLGEVGYYLDDDNGYCSGIMENEPVHSAAEPGVVLSAAHRRRRNEDAGLGSPNDATGGPAMIGWRLPSFMLWVGLTCRRV